jgi:ADP-heptose:LPS heptosyltransferase
MPTSLAPEIRADAKLAEAAKKILPHDNAIICHVASSRSKKEWPMPHWAKFHQLATTAGMKLVFTTAKGEREQALMSELKRLVPDAEILSFVPDLPLFVAVLARGKVFISGDTGPLHFAVALNVPTISLFGPSPSVRWAPVGEKHQVLRGSPCTCNGRFPDCRSPRFCLAEISPEAVFAALQKTLAV